MSQSGTARVDQSGPLKCTQRPAVFLLASTPEPGEASPQEGKGHSLQVVLYDRGMYGPISHSSILGWALNALIVWHSGRSNTRAIFFAAGSIRQSGNHSIVVAV